MRKVSSEDVDRLLAAAGLPAAGAGSELRRVAGGANNRVYAVLAPDPRAVLKVYFQDGRPRLAAEFSFLELARARGVDAVAAPLARDDAAGIALYGYLHGRRMTARDVGRAAVEQAASLFASVNAPRGRPPGHALPFAAEACFTVSEHLERVEERVRRLAAIRPADDLDELAAALVEDRLRPSWEQVEKRALAAAAEQGLDLEQPIPEAERCVSPSDLGFHNALIDEAGRISFLDFEYAGWDDPAKLVCDFFRQVAVSAPRDEQARFQEIALAPFGDPEPITARIALLAPVYRVKWTCIVLNDFLAHGRARRGYALGADRDRERRSTQILKATALLDGAG